MQRGTRWFAVPVALGLLLAITAVASPTRPVAAANASGHLSAGVSDPTPAYHTMESVTATFLDENNQPVSGLKMKTTWYANGHKSTCSGTTNAQGVAGCSREVKAKSGHTVKVLVRVKYRKRTYEREVQFTVK